MAFQRKLANHIAAVSLYAAYFNLCRVHETLRITPAMAIGITDHIWSVGELIDTAGNREPPSPSYRPFDVILGGRN
jgi:hypothetical protein